LIEMASTDELSGLNNRRRFRESAKEAYQRAQRYQEPVSVLMMDLDYFKKINDSFGHLAGDAVIRDFSKMLQTTFRGTDVIGRMGGEEFAVVMLDTDEIKAYQKAEYFRQTVERKSVLFEQQQIRLTVSIGVAELKEETLNFDALMNKADSALYVAKRAGRNCTVIDNQSRDKMIDA
jgi:diguanylate cyclase (GGDEF)-like protein